MAIGCIKPEQRITGQHFRVQNFDNLSEFYVDLLGMKEVETADGASDEIRAFAYDVDQCSVIFHQSSNSLEAQPYHYQDNDFYWKIGITLWDLDAAIAYLRRRGVAVADPYQFQKIGYMSRITDPNGFSIELLQQGFEGNSKPLPLGFTGHPAEHPVGSQATLAHITLRVTDIASAKSYFEDELGMRLMSVQPVQGRDFCLYFYSWSQEPLPNPDLKAVENREWLWRRPYTLIELQHLEFQGAKVHRPDPISSGFDGFSYMDNAHSAPTRISLSDLSVLS